MFQTLQSTHNNRNTWYTLETGKPKKELQPVNPGQSWCMLRCQVWVCGCCIGPEVCFNPQQGQPTKDNEGSAWTAGPHHKCDVNHPWPAHQCFERAFLRQKRSTHEQAKSSHLRGTLALKQPSKWHDGHNPLSAMQELHLCFFHLSLALCLVAAVAMGVDDIALLVVTVARRVPCHGCCCSVGYDWSAGMPAVDAA